MSALTKGQKGYLAQLAARAYRVRPSVIGGAEDGISLDDWRRQQVGVAVNKAGLRCCSQFDFKAVEGHFLALLGDIGGAFNAHVRAATEPRRQAQWKLREACAQAGLHIAYAEAICQRQFHCVLDDATEKQLWNIKFTIDRRARARKNGRAERREADYRSSQGVAAFRPPDKGHYDAAKKQLFTHA